MPDIRITPMIAIPAPVEDPRDVLTIYAIVVINLVIALAIFCARFL